MKLLPDHVIVVLDIVIQLMNLDLFKSRFSEKIPRFFPAPHRTQAFTSLCEGDRHAVHAGDGIEERCERKVQIIMDMARISRE